MSETVHNSALRATQRVFQSWLGCIAAVFVRELDQRTHKTGSSALIILEPVAFVLAISSAHYFLSGGHPLYGNSVLLFYATGIFPHYVFIWVSVRISQLDLKAAHFPRIQILDEVIAIATLEVLTLLCAMTIMFVGLWMWGIEQARPDDLATVFEVCSVLTVFGLGIGLINACVTPYFPFWRQLYAVLIRVSLLASGLFFIPDFLRPEVRYWFCWNPLLHGGGWFRLAFYPNYPSLVLDKEFLILCAVLAIVIGLASERATRQIRALR